MPDVVHDTTQYANNRAELSHQPTRARERGMRRFKSTHQAQRFLSTHAAVYNLLNLGRHLISAKHYRVFRQRAFASWNCAAATQVLHTRKKARAEKLICQHRSRACVSVRINILFHLGRTDNCKPDRPLLPETSLSPDMMLGGCL
jgi:hypothetical protein